MRLVQFTDGSHSRVGIEVKKDGDIIDLHAVNSSIASNMKKFLEGGATSLSIAQRALESGEHMLPRENVTILSPVTEPEKVICVGMNYVDHCEEVNAPIPTKPLIFSKFASAITHPGSPIYLPSFTKKLDWEVELAIIIGKKGKNIEEHNAMDHVAGFTVAHDVSARDWQLEENGGQWLLGKTSDSFLPLGPALVTKDEIEDPHDLGIRCRVNGATKQDSNTKNLVFKTEKLISFISQFFTLVPGDIISTGTPPGVGCFQKPPVFLKVGDVVECEIDGIGTIQNTIVEEKSGLSGTL